MKAIVSAEKWTYSKMLEKLPPESRYEIRNNYLIDMPAPSFTHQTIAKKVFKKLENFIDEKNNGTLIFAPFDVIFEEENTVQPDLLFVANEHKNIIRERGIFGSPDLIIEIVSKSSVVRDYVEKKEDYERFGVKEYWIIDPQYQMIQVFVLENSKYKSYSSADESGSVQSKIIEGFELNWEDLFES